MQGPNAIGFTLQWNIGLTQFQYIELAHKVLNYICCLVIIKCKVEYSFKADLYRI